MRRLLTILPVLYLFMVLPTMAQTLTTDAPAPVKAWEILLKIGAPILSMLSPFVTKYVTMGLLKVMTVVPVALQAGISSLFSAVILGMAGAFTDFPLSPESAATVGVGIGAASQGLATMEHDTVQPNPNVKGPNTAKPEK